MHIKLLDKNGAILGEFETEGDELAAAITRHISDRSLAKILYPDGQEIDVSLPPGGLG
jgi:hypothetical protein